MMIRRVFFTGLVFFGVGACTYAKLIKGVEGSGVLFDDKAAAVSVASCPSLNPADAVSLEAWVSLSGPEKGYGSVIRKDNSYALRFSGNVLGFIVWRDGQFDILSAEKTDWEADRWLKTGFPAIRRARFKSR